jgi:phosphoserine phosphatase RsbU/P
VEEAVERLARVTAEKERINAELDIACQIQTSLLPCVFPAYPDRPEFDIYASISPAKEVGGDFYDFFMIDDNHLGVVIADVSGKGIPAALFMMVAKTLIKNNALMHLTPAETLARANAQLCENNSASMFVTVFMGILNVRTGEFTYVNAGHNFPLIRHANEEYGWLKSKVRLVLGFSDSAQYEDCVIKVSQGDTLFLYTDGVTEALDEQQQMFGSERLIELMNASTDLGPRALLMTVRQAIDAFASGAPQHDDITMLAVCWAGM